MILVKTAAETAATAWTVWLLCLAKSVSYVLLLNPGENGLVHGLQWFIVPREWLHVCFWSSGISCYSLYYMYIIWLSSHSCYSLPTCSLHNFAPYSAKLQNPCIVATLCPLHDCCYAMPQLADCKFMHNLFHYSLRQNRLLAPSEVCFGYKIIYIDSTWSTLSFCYTL